VLDPEKQAWAKLRRKKNMVMKRFCDVCGAELPNSAKVPHDEAVKMYQGMFAYGAVVVDEHDDLCKECGAKVRDFIRQLKKEEKL
jgi:hypothetical protein